MATNFFLIGYHFENLGAKRLSEKIINFMPCEDVCNNRSWLYCAFFS